MVKTRDLPESIKPSLINKFLSNEQEQFSRSAITREQIQEFMKLYFVDKDIFGIGRDRIFTYLKSKEGLKFKYTFRQVNRLLNAFMVNQLFKRKVIRDKDIQAQSNITSAPFNRIEADLLDMSVMEDDGKKFLLTAIDQFSKYGWAIPIANKESKTVLKAFGILKKEMDAKAGQLNVKSILTDNGSEFINAEMEKWFIDNKIKHIYTKAHSQSSHAKMVERFNLLIRQMIAKYMKQFNDNHWVEYLPLLLANYNKTISRVTKQAPDDVIKQTSAEELKNTKQNIEHSVLPKNSKGVIADAYEVGDLVRLKQETPTHEKKSSNINWSEELYEIDKVIKPKSNSVLQTSYRIKNVETGEKINEKFFHNELSKSAPMLNVIESNPKWVVKEILQPRMLRDKKTKTYKRQVLVKWEGEKELFWQDYETLLEDIPKIVKTWVKKWNVVWGKSNVKFTEPAKK